MFSLSFQNSEKKAKSDNHWTEIVLLNVKRKEKRLYIRMEFSQSLGMNFVSPFQPEREFKVNKSCKCSQIICSRVH